MSIFETVKAAVTPKQAAQTYGLRMQRNGMCRCPFHNDRTPSLKFYDDHYHCFGCQVTGDVIDFVVRYFDISPYEAAKKLAEDFSVVPNDHAAPVKPKRPYLEKFREDERMCFSVLVDYLHLLQKWKVQYAPKSRDEKDWDDRFVEACQMLSVIEHLVDLFLVAELEERISMVEMLMKEDTIYPLKNRMERLKREECYDKGQEIA